MASWEVGSKVITQKCYDSRSSQKWIVDEDGRIHTKDDHILSISRTTSSNITTEKVVQHCYSKVWQGWSLQKYVCFNVFDYIINFRRNGFKVISANGDEAKIGKSIRIPRRQIIKVMQQWKIYPP